METYIIIKKCDKETAWYSNKIGHTFKLDREISFPDLYTIRISNDKNKANYGTVCLNDAEIITPTINKRIKMYINKIFKR